ncbi:hypothetical protein [Sagittula sp. SSi028]|uniref:hypothetical protein n=1 Tax=Sagittula sp. SSi028 TaxID=3400636 RepID=UPI003AF50A86
MSTSPSTEILLGCDPQVRLVVIEDGGNLLLQVFAEDPENTDLDALFFNLNDPSLVDTLTIYPGFDESIGSNGENVTGFDVATGSLNQMNNGAQIQDNYDVRLEFGTVPYSSNGDVDQAMLTMYMDGGDYNLDISDLDLTNLTAVVNTETGNGLALTGGVGTSTDTPGGVYETTTVLTADFEGIAHATDSAQVQYNDGWDITNGQLETNGHDDGNIWFEAVDISGNATVSFDARAPHTEYFEAGGTAGDSLAVWVQIDGAEWELLDTFTVNADGTALVGDTTGQTITADTQTLTYSGGALDGANTVQLVLSADISAANEQIFVDNVEVSDTVWTGATETVVEENEVLVETFDSGSNTSAAHADAVDGRTGWDMRHGELQTDGYDDGGIRFQEVSVDGPATISIDARTPNAANFENSGHHADTLEMWALIDGSEWVHLDTFMVNDAGTALVGNTTGQTIDADGETLTYEGGALAEASSVQFYMRSDISASNEQIYFDNLTITETVETEVPVEGGDSGSGVEVVQDFDEGQSGDTVSDQYAGVTVTAQRTGDAADSENDAMLFDTANPTGGDSDLAYTGQGNAIIISEDNDASDADDNAHGGTISFEFDTVADVAGLTILDVEEEGGSIDLYDVDGELINSVAIPGAGNNSLQEIELNAEGVARLDVNLTGSGAVDDLRYTDSSSAEHAECAQYAVLFDDLTKDDEEDGLAEEEAQPAEEELVFM